MRIRNNISSVANKRLESIYSVDVAATIIEWANAIQEKCISLRSKYYSDMNKGFDYNEAGIRTGRTMSELTADEEIVNSITGGIVKVQLTSHRHIIIYICAHGESTDEIINADNNEFIYNIRPGNEFGVYSNENNKDDKNNNVYNKIASEIVNIFNKLNNNIVKEIMKKIPSQDATNIANLAQRVQKLAITAVINVENGADKDKESESFSKKVLRFMPELAGISLNEVHYNGGKGYCRVDMKSIAKIAEQHGNKWPGKVAADKVAEEILKGFDNKRIVETKSNDAAITSSNPSTSGYSTVGMVINDLIKNLCNSSSLISELVSRSSLTLSTMLAEKTDGFINKCELNGDNLVVYSKNGVSENICIKNSDDEHVHTCVNHLMLEDKKKVLWERINSMTSSELDDMLKKVA